MNNLSQAMDNTSETEAPQRPGLFSKERWLNTGLSGVQLLGNGAMIVSGVYDGNWFGRVLVPTAQSALAVVRLRGTMSTSPLEGKTRLEQAKDALKKPDSMWFQTAASIPLFITTTASQIYEGIVEGRTNQLVDTAVSTFTYSGAIIDAGRRVDEVNATAEAKTRSETDKAELPDQNMEFSQSSGQVVGWKKVAAAGLRLATSRFTGYAAQAIALGGRTLEGIELMGNDPNAATPLLVNTALMTALTVGNVVFTEQKMAKIRREYDTIRVEKPTMPISPSHKEKGNQNAIS